MASFKIRPKFEIELDESPDSLLKKFLEEKESSTCGCIIDAVPNHIVIKIKEEEQHFWSPQLTLNFEEIERGAKVKGLYGPNGNVWTLFTGSYFACGVLITFIAIIGFSNKSLGIDAPILWALPVLFGIIILLYIASQMGQKLGAEQMFDLHHTAQEILGEKIHFY